MSEAAEILPIDLQQPPHTEGGCAEACRTSCSQAFETILHELPGAHANERLLVVRVERCGESVLLLRQQNRADGIGWFTQSSVEVQPGQLGPLRMALQTSPPMATGLRPRRPIPPRRLKVVS